MTDSRQNTQNWLIRTLEEIVEDDLSEVDHSANLADHGLDSIRVFELVQKLRSIRPDIQFYEVAENLSIAGLEGVIAAGPPR